MMPLRILRVPIAFLLLVAAFLGAVPSFADEAKSLSIDEAKFQMLQLYTEAKLPPMKLKHKYPELLKADKRVSAARKAYSAAIREHPNLKPQFDEIDQLDISFPEKLKLQKPLFAKAETLPSHEPIRTKYHQARFAALNEETSALRKEGHEDLADKLSAILRLIK